MSIHYSEAQVAACKKFVHQYGYKWDKKTEPSDFGQTAQKAFYYTTVSTFHKFAENGCLWASHIKRMNDWQEFELGRQLVLDALIEFAENQSSHASQETIEYIQEAIFEAKRIARPGGTNQRFGYGRTYVDYWHPEVYNISFTRESDLLSQWKMYARESGVAIEFDFSRASTFWQKAVHNETDTMDFKQENCIPRRVNYQVKQLKQQLECDLGQINKDPELFAPRMIQLLEQIPFIKHSGFSQEGESRLIFRPHKRLESDDTITHSKVGYREAGHLLIPYLEIYCGQPADPKADLAHSIGWPVVSVTVGPGHDQDVVFESLIHRLEYGKTQFRPFTEEEKFLANKKFILEFIRQHIKQHPCLRDMDGKVHRLKDNSAKAQSALEEIKEKLHTDQEFQKEYTAYCAGHYLCDSGLLIKKSQIPYIFT